MSGLWNRISSAFERTDIGTAGHDERHEGERVRPTNTRYAPIRNAVERRVGAFLREDLVSHLEIGDNEIFLLHYIEIVADSQGMAEWLECLVKGGFARGAAGGHDLIETMRFDPDAGVPRLELHLARIKASAAELGFAFDRHDTRNRIQALCFELEAPTGSPFPSDRFTLPEPRNVTGLAVNLPKPDCDARHVFSRNHRQHSVLAAPGQPHRALRRQALAGHGAEVFVEHGGAQVNRADIGPFENLFGQIVLPHPRRRGVRRGLQHHEVDQPRYAGFARSSRHGRGRVHQPVLHRIGEVDRAGALGGPLHRADVEEIALDDLGAEPTQMLGALVDLVDKGAHGDFAREQHLGKMAAGLALPAAGR